MIEWTADDRGAIGEKAPKYKHIKRFQEEGKVADWLPEGFKREMQEILGEEYGQYLESFERPVSRGLRVNTLKWDRQECMEKMPWRTKAVPWIANGLFYEGEDRLSKDPYYFAGLYYLQEPSAMTPASLLPVEPGDMVLDLCAAPGGKSTELGAKLKGRGMLVANDISNSRAKALLKNLERFGISNMCVLSETPQRLSGAFPGFFDKILVDAPCSGEGMFRKDRGMVKEWEEKGPEYYSALQRDIMGEAVKMLKAGGYLLYSTCTFSREEDEEIVQWVLDGFPDMELMSVPLFEGASGGIGLTGCIRLFPHKIRGEGHFAALLRKREAKEEVEQTAKSGDMKFQKSQGPFPESGCGENLKQRKKGSGREKMGQRTEALKESKKTLEYSRRRGKHRENHRSANDPGMDLGGELEDFLKETKMVWDGSRIIRKHDMVYYLPEGFVEGTGLRFLRTGLWMGTIKNGRFEPSQAIAMTLDNKGYPNCVSFGREDIRVVRYLKGETISLEEGEGPVQGWCLVCVDGFALGFGKGNGMTIKNKYYAGWRWQ